MTIPERDETGEKFVDDPLEFEGEPITNEDEDPAALEGFDEPEIDA